MQGVSNMVMRVKSVDIKTVPVSSLFTLDIKTREKTKEVSTAFCTAYQGVRGS